MSSLGSILASAGGGGGFHGGFSGGGSGGFSGGSGGFSSHGVYVGGGGSLVVIIIVFVVVFGWGFYKRSKGNGSTSYPTSSGTYVGMPAPPPVAPVDPSVITATDPTFDLNVFATDAERTFFLVQKAWVDRTPDIARQVMAEDIYQQQSSQIQTMKDQHIINRLDGLAVASTTPISINTGPAGDQIVVRYHAASADYNMNDETQKIVSGHQNVTEWWEDWTFTRPPGSKSAADTVMSTCPSCGAPLATDLAGVCTYCHHPVVGNDQGWRLSHISQTRG